MGFGRDVAADSVGDGFGHELLRLSCPVRYLWSAATTPAASQEFLRTHAIAQQQLAVAHHWSWVVEPDTVAAAILSS